MFLCLPLPPSLPPSRPPSRLPQHPGNILVRMDPVGGGLTSRLPAWMDVGGWLKLPRLVLLDVGMIARLSAEDQLNLVDFFKGLTSMNGAELADSIISFSEERPANPIAFRWVAGCGLRARGRAGVCVCVSGR